ncbi:uncharacterized protein N7459_008883 [Penicillium hispanicum]|uniref:uncharacterized protein n=1 Tax=Penicillium hispanicum TaxID=1080232 RepID=UPI00253F896F|nr:uncharacterized protein N7459_008883 [Penicillium hispanicum]KAJ5569453.1 hypothetical protein N7459_008883 [Penicillium hispanicum]
MKFIPALSCGLATLHVASAAPAPQTLPGTADAVSVSVSYDQKYDVSDSSLTTVSCSDGENGLITKGYSTFGSLPSFPLIGGAPTVDGWNSPNCGKCYQLQYTGETVETINVTAIDAAPGGFNIGLTAMNRLTNNQATQLGRITATYTLVSNSACGMKD